MSVHSLMSGDELHDAYHYVQETDPGAIGTGKYWLIVSTGTVKRRNTDNSGWTVVSPGFLDVTTTKGDLMVRGAAALGRLAIGTNDQVLVADSTQTLGMKWSTPSGGGGSGYVTPPPATNGATGALGTYSADTDYFYICIATNTWKKVKLTNITGVFAWASNGDINGYLYYRGTVDNTTVWTNPSTIGQVTIVTSALGSGVLGSTLCNRASDDFLTTNVANSFIGVDFGVGHALKVNTYIIRNRSSFSSEALRNWKLQGTNSVSANTEAGFNAATWVDLDTHIADATLTASNQWGKFVITLTTTAYRYLRILQNGTNSSGSNYICAGEFEFYGEE